MNTTLRKLQETGAITMSWAARTQEFNWINASRQWTVSHGRYSKTKRGLSSAVKMWQQVHCSNLMELQKPNPKNGHKIEQKEKKRFY